MEHGRKPENWGMCPNHSDTVLTPAQLNVLNTPPAPPKEWKNVKEYPFLHSTSLILIRQLNLIRPAPTSAPQKIKLNVHQMMNPWSSWKILILFFFLLNKASVRFFSKILHRKKMASLTKYVIMCVLRKKHLGMFRLGSEPLSINPTQS